jgi:hypothetical protein
MTTPDKYLFTFEHRIGGVPCTIGVLSYESVRGTFSRNAASDLDYHGWFDCEWHVLDEDGQLSPDLAAKATWAEDEEIRTEVQHLLSKRFRRD